YYYAQALEFSGRIDEALEEYRSTRVVSPGVHFLRALEGACRAKCGQLDQARSIAEEIEEIRREDYVDAYYVAILAEALGMRDTAFRELERALQEDSVSLCLVEVDPKLDSLRLDSRFVPLRSRILSRAHISSFHASGNGAEK